MPDVIFAILLVLSRQTTMISFTEVADQTGYVDGHVSKYTGVLRRLGLVDMRHQVGWWITDRGRIAIALEVGRRARWPKRRPKIRTWVARYSGTEEKEMTAPLEKTFAVLVAAAVAGERCPMGSGPVASINHTHVGQLAHAGRIFVEISSRNWRRVTILEGEHKGKATAPNPDPKATTYLTIGLEGTKRGGRFVQGRPHGQQPSAPRLMTKDELKRL